MGGREEGGRGGGGRYTEDIYIGIISSNFCLRPFRNVCWLGEYFSSVSEFHVVGNENNGNLFTSSILGWGIY